MLCCMSWTVLNKEGGMEYKKDESKCEMGSETTSENMHMSNPLS